MNSKAIIGVFYTEIKYIIFSNNKNYIKILLLLLIIPIIPINKTIINIIILIEQKNFRIFFEHKIRIFSIYVNVLSVKILPCYLRLLMNIKTK